MCEHKQYLIDDEEEEEEEEQKQQNPNPNSLVVVATELCKPRVKAPLPPSSTASSSSPALFVLGMLPKSTGFVTVAASGECAKLVQERETRKKKTKEKERFRRLPALPLVAAVDVERFGYCMYILIAFSSVCFLSFFLRASCLLARSLAPGSSSMERERRGSEDWSDGHSSRRSL